MPTSPVLWNASLKSAFRHQNVGGGGLPQVFVWGGMDLLPPLLRCLWPVHVKCSELSVEGQDEAKFLVQDNNAMEKIELKLRRSDLFTSSPQRFR